MMETQTGPASFRSAVPGRIKGETIMLSYGQYQNIVRLTVGENKPGTILVEMKKWARQQYGIHLMDATFDSNYYGSSVLSIVVYDIQDYERTGRGKDPEISSAFCRKYIEECRDASRDAPEGFEAITRAEFSCFTDDARPWLLDEAAEEITAIQDLPYYHKDMGLMRVRVSEDTVFFFYDRALQCWQGFSHGINNELRARVNELVRRHDQAGVFRGENVPCVFFSMQELRLDYHGKMDEYIQHMKDIGKTGRAAG